MYTFPVKSPSSEGEVTLLALQFPAVGELRGRGAQALQTMSPRIKMTARDQLPLPVDARPYIPQVIGVVQLVVPGATSKHRPAIGDGYLEQRPVAQDQVAHVFPTLQQLIRRTKILGFD